MDVALQCVAYDEDGLSETMDAWASQVDPGHNVSCEAWVTPDGPKEACRTWQAATDHSVFQAYEAPQYKLRARNAAHDSAVSRGYDAFVTCDADAPPLRKDSLRNLLSALSEPQTAAAVSNPKTELKPTGLISTVGVKIKESIGGMHGQCHAITADAWREAGPFTDDVDHTEVSSVWLEEEYKFTHRLRQAGNVRYVYDAPVYNDTRRRDCRWQRTVRRKSRDDFCDRPEGNNTFSPRKRI